MTAPVASGFKLLARARRGRALHPDGEVWQATVVAAPAGRHLTGGDGPAVVRISRAVGLPDWLPDVHGVAIRLPGPGPVDILLAGSSRRAPWALVPSFDRLGTYSSLAHYRMAGKRVRIVADLRPGRVSLFSETNGEFTPLAEIVLDRRTDEPIRFRPTAAGPRLSSVGPLNALRPAAYRASQEQATSS